MMETASKTRSRDADRTDFLKGQELYIASNLPTRSAFFLTKFAMKVFTSDEWRSFNAEYCAKNRSGMLDDCLVLRDVVDHLHGAPVDSSKVCKSADVGLCENGLYDLEGKLFEVAQMRIFHGGVAIVSSIVKRALVNQGLAMS